MDDYNLGNILKILCSHRRNSRRIPRAWPGCCCGWSDGGCRGRGTHRAATWADCCAWAWDRRWQCWSFLWESSSRRRCETDPCTRILCPIRISSGCRNRARFRCETGTVAIFVQRLYPSSHSLSKSVSIIRSPSSFLSFPSYPTFLFFPLLRFSKFFLPRMLPFFLSLVRFHFRKEGFFVRFFLPLPLLLRFLLALPFLLLRPLRSCTCSLLLSLCSSHIHCSLFRGAPVHRVWKNIFFISFFILVIIIFIYIRFN